MAMVSEFIAAVNQICAERGINQEEVFNALEAAVLSAYKKELDKEDVDNITVELNRETGQFKYIVKKTVSKKVENADVEISLKEAQTLNKKLKDGDVVELELPVENFGRIAAQTAKQVILQKIGESERQSIIDEYSGKVGEIFTALMQRMQRGQVLFEIGKATAIMPQEDQIPNEFYKVGEKYKVLLKGIEDSAAGKSLVVSRSDPKFLIELFKLEVPEMESGAVEVKACAREAGSRSKIAVVSHQEGIDPIGSCVGQRGMRIANVMSELGEEKIDIIEWHKDLEQFVANALSPAKVDSVSIEDGVAVVKVAEDQLSLAIGRDGQNVRLAYKLTNIKIDIQGPDSDSKKSGKEEAVNEEVVEENVDRLPSVGEPSASEVAQPEVVVEPTPEVAAVEEKPAKKKAVKKVTEKEVKTKKTVAKKTVKKSK